MVEAFALSASSLAHASSESVLYTFPAGSNVYGQVQEDSHGNLYGTAYYSADNYGSVYEVKEHRGHWRGKIIHKFGSGSDGQFPYAGLTPDRTNGIFYGTTQSGGASGFGTAFSLVQSGRQWTENVLHDFDGFDGGDPSAVMIRDKATGVLFGTAAQNGAYDCGTAFQLDPATEQFDVLYNFQGGSDGCEPETQMRPGSKAGTLLGATVGGGAHNDGTLFQLTESGGNWTESLLHSFSGGSDGATPVDITEPADVIAASTYGVAKEAGAYGAGLVFRISKPHRTWVYEVIYTFTGGSDGGAPVGLRLDQQTGFLYGTTAFGGNANEGVVFNLAPLRGSWSETVLHSFSGGSDGSNPQSRPYIDAKTGVLYGTTLNGGIHNGGVVYAVTP